MSEARDVSEHLLIRALVPFRELDYAIQDKHFPIVHRLKYKDILKVRPLMEKHLFHL